ncbi:MAG TPA: aldo/keto reductase, partial [bacterium]|nr:aldo/keto reductase [bacterium]
QLEMGLGTWAWGKGIVWGFGKGYNEKDLQQTFNASLDAGIRLVDTAEVYGDGESEIFVGRFLKERPDEKIYVATKFAPMPYRFQTSSLLKALKASLSRLGLGSVDLYQMHWPSPPRTIKAWMEPMAQAVEEGLAKEIGVSNFSRDQMLRAQEALAAYGVPLASNQMQYSLVRRKQEFNGLLEECQKTKVRFIAYSPLGMGMLSGKYSPRNPPSGPRRLFYWGQLGRIQALVEKLNELGMAHGGKTVNQVALNWLLCKGALPIPGAKNAAQAKENAGAMGWRLNPAEVAELDEASRDFKG